MCLFIMHPEHYSVLQSTACLNTMESSVKPLKLIMLGASGSGKTSLVQSFI